MLLLPTVAAGNDGNDQEMANSCVGGQLIIITETYYTFYCKSQMVCC